MNLDPNITPFVRRQQFEHLHRVAPIDVRKVRDRKRYQRPINADDYSWPATPGWQWFLGGVALAVIIMIGWLS